MELTNNYTFYKVIFSYILSLRLFTLNEGVMNKNKLFFENY